MVVAAEGPPIMVNSCTGKARCGTRCAVRGWLPVACVHAAGRPPAPAATRRTPPALRPWPPWRSTSAPPWLLQMGHATAEAVVRAGLTLIPFSFTGSSEAVAVGNIGVCGIPVELVHPDERVAVVQVRGSGGRKKAGSVVVVCKGTLGSGPGPVDRDGARQEAGGRREAGRRAWLLHCPAEGS